MTADFIPHSSLLTHHSAGVSAAGVLAIGVWGLPLFTAAAGAAPIIIHLLNRLRYDRVRWAAMDFLLASKKRNRRRMQLEQLLLLALRVLIMLLLAAAFARIAWGPSPERSPAAAVGGPESHIVLLDAGMSMGAQVGPAGTGMDAARNEIRALVGKLKADDDFGLVIVGRQAVSRRDPAPLAEGDREGMASLLGEIRPDDTEADFGAALDLLYRRDEGTGAETGLLPTLEGRRKRRVIHVVSDLRRAGWASGARPPAKLAEGFAAVAKRFDAVLDVVDVAKDTPVRPDNLAVVGLEPVRTLGTLRGNTVAAGRDVEFLVTVANYGDREQTVRLDGYADGKRQTGTDALTVPPRGDQGPGTATATVVFRFEPAGGVRPPGETPARFGEAAVQLVGPGGEPVGDALAADDRRFTTVRVVEAVRVLLVSGDVGPADLDMRVALPILSAINPRPDEGEVAPAAVEVRHLSEEDFRNTAADPAAVERGVFRNTDCVLLSNVDQVPSNLVDDLGRFVEAGGLLAVFAGDRLKTAVYNDELFRRDRRLLPASLGEPVDAPRLYGRPVAIAEDSLDADHPLLADLKGMVGTILSPQGVQVGRFFRVTPELAEPPADAPPGPDGRPRKIPELAGVRVLARYTDPTEWVDGKPGSPAILARRVGQGQVVLFTTTPGRPWNDWGADKLTHPGFLAVGHGLLETAVTARTPEITAGRDFAAELTAGDRGGGRLRELGLVYRSEPAAAGGGRSVGGLEQTPRDSGVSVRVPAAASAGLYRIVAGDGDEVETFAVNPVNAVGDLTRLSGAETDDLFGKAAVRAAGGPADAPGSNEIVEVQDPDETRPPFTPFDQAVVQWLLAAMMALMVVETILSRKFAHYE